MTNELIVFLHVLYLLNAPAPDYCGGPGFDIEYQRL